MVNTTYLVSMVSMGVLGVGVVLFVVRSRPWRHYVPRASYDLAAGERPTSGLADLAGRTGTWTAAYVLLVLGFMFGAMAYAGGMVTGPAVIGAVVALVAATAGDLLRAGAGLAVAGATLWSAPVLAALGE